MSSSLCTVCQNRRRRKMFAMQTADHDVHDDADRMLLFAVSLNADDGPLAWHVGRHCNVAPDVFGVSKRSYTSMSLSIATI